MDAFWKPIRANNWDVETYRKFPKNRTYNRQIRYKFKNRDQNTRPANHLVIIVFRQLMQIDTENERFKGYGVMYLSYKVYQFLISKLVTLIYCASLMNVLVLIFHTNVIAHQCSATKSFHISHTEIYNTQIWTSPDYVHIYETKLYVLFQHHFYY